MPKPEDTEFNEDKFTVNWDTDLVKVSGDVYWNLTVPKVLMPGTEPVPALVTTMRDLEDYIGITDEDRKTGDASEKFEEWINTDPMAAWMPNALRMEIAEFGWAAPIP